MRKAIQFFLRLFISIGIISFLFSKIDRQNFFNIVKALDIKILIGAFLVFLLSNFLGLYRWKNILDAMEIDFYFKDILSSFSAGLFFNLLLPSAIGGDILRSLDFIARTHKPKEVLSSIFLDRLSGYIGLDIVLISSLIIGYRLIKDKDILWITSIFSIFLILILLFLFNNFLYSKLNYLLSLFKNRFFYILKEIHQCIYYFKNKKFIVLFNLSISLIIQLLLCFVFFIISLSLGISIKIEYFFIFIPIIGVITILPISLGGLGLREASTIFFFSKIGIPKDICLAMALINSIFFMILACLGGIIYVFTLHLRRIQPYKELSI